MRRSLIRNYIRHDIPFQKLLAQIGSITENSYRLRLALFLRLKRQIDPLSDALRHDI